MQKELKLVDKMIDDLKRRQNTPFTYSEFENGKVILIAPLMQLFSGKLFLLNWYLERNKFSDLNYQNSDISLSMQHVQTQNIKSNLEIVMFP